MVDFVYHGIQRTFRKNTRQRIQELELRGASSATSTNTEIDFIADWKIGVDGLPIIATKDEPSGFKKQGSMRSGYAFSHEEHGAVPQSMVIRSYDTTLQKPTGQ